MAHLADKRKKFLVKPDGSTDIRVDLVGDDQRPRVWLQCAACGDEMIESDRSGILECPECGHDISSAEVEILGKKHTSVLCERFGLPEGNKKRGLLWRFLGWFGRSKRLPAPKS